MLLEKVFFKITPVLLPTNTSNDMSVCGPCIVRRLINELLLMNCFGIRYLSADLLSEGDRKPAGGNKRGGRHEKVSGT